MSTPATPDYSAARAERKLIGIPLVVTAIVGIPVSVVACLVAGVAGLVGGLLGTLVVLAFFGLGQLVVARTLRTNPAIAMNMAMLVYLVQIVVLFVLLLLLRQTTVFAPKAFAAAVFAGVIVWTVAAVVVMSRTRILYVEPAPDNTRAADPGEEGRG